MTFKHVFVFLITMTVIAAGLVYFLNLPPFFMDNNFLIVHEGDSLTHVAKDLKKNNLIRNSDYYKYLAIATKKTKVIAGKYRIISGMTSYEIIKKLASGDVLRRKVTIPEGLNMFEISELLEKNYITDSEHFLKLSEDTQFLKSVGIEQKSIEGFLFPDTYIFPENKPADDIIRTMCKEFGKMFTTLDLSNLKRLSINNYELIIIASLIEEEAQVAKERSLIASVFHNRLKKRIALGCDPTVRYAVKKFKGKITYADLKTDSPYNTYLHRGLPPTPICSPGKESILAALHPAESSFLYFVSRNDGSHYFSRNLREHNKAVDFYQKGKRNGFKDNQKL